MSTPPNAAQAIPAEIQPEVQRLARETVNTLDSLTGPAALSPVARTLSLLMFADRVYALALAHWRQEAREQMGRELVAAVIEMAEGLPALAQRAWDEAVTKEGLDQ